MYYSHNVYGWPLLLAFIAAVAVVALMGVALHHS